MRRYRTHYRNILLFAVFGFTSPIHATSFLTHSAAEITTALQSALPGDTLIMADGIWTNQVITFSGNGVTLRAQTAGRVILSGSSKLSITGSNLTMDGLNFRGGALGAGEYIVRFASSAKNSRLTNSSIIDYNPPDPATRYFWVGIQGQDNRVDHNFFRGQSNSGVTVVVLPVVGTSSRAQIDNNHFVDRPAGTGNGFETIRVGTSDVQTASAQVIVERNLFERTNGEAETISNKSSDNIFRYNTFRDVEGTLTLRHGKRAIVEGNYFLGRNNPLSGGIRVIGSDHIIRNNYLADLGSRSNGAIVLTTGDSDFVPSGPGNTSGYEPVLNVQLTNNTVINTKDATIRLDDLYGNDTLQTIRPVNVTLANNLLYNTQTSTFKGTVGTGFTWAGNIASGNSLGITSRSGITQVNPNVTKDSYELYHLLLNSPAIDTAATGSWLAPTDDIEGQPRFFPLDIGADEFSAAAATRSPLWGSDVGPAWLNRRSNGYPISSAPLIHFKAAAFTAVTDPNADTQTWQVITANGASILKAPTGPRIDLPGTTQDTVVEYDVAFHDTGVYYLSILARGFDTSSDSLYVPSTLGADPSISKSLSSTGEWTWVELGTYTITTAQLNEPLTLKLGRRESAVELDTIMFSMTHFPVSVPEPGTAVLFFAPSLLMFRSIRTPDRR